MESLMVEPEPADVIYGRSYEAFLGSLNREERERMVKTPV